MPTRIFTKPPKRLLYKGFVYTLATKSDEKATWSTVAGLVGDLQEAVNKAAAEPTQDLISSRQTIARLWDALNNHLKLLLPK